MAKKKRVKKVKKAREIEETIRVPKAITAAAKARITKTLSFKKDREIARDFSTKVYARLGKIIKSIVLFGSAAKGRAEKTSDIDLVIIIDDATVQWDQELIAWYREELGKIVKANPYRKPLHINTVRLTTWWTELLRGEPVVVNIIRWGEAMIDFGGFFSPLKVLLAEGKIKGTPETVFITLGRAPAHMIRAKSGLLGAIEGLYWAFVDSAHSALMAAGRSPPSPEHIPAMLEEQFVRKKMLSSKYISWYQDLYTLTHKILRTEITDIKGADVDDWRNKADLFVREMATIANKLTKKR